MFKKRCKLTETQSKVNTSKHISSMDSQVNNLPKLIGFSYRELPLPENYTHPLENYLSIDITDINKSLCTKLYLPKHIFLLNFAFNCTPEISEPKITHGQVTTEEEIDQKITTKAFLHKKKVEHKQVRRLTTECIINLGDLPLADYLKTYGSDVQNVKEFLSLYESAEKKFQRDLPLRQELDFNL